MILEGKLAKRAKSRIGMIEPRFSSSNAARQGFSVARVVVKPDNKIVPLHVLKCVASTSPIELVASENLADFCPLVESCLSQPHICGAVGNKVRSQLTSDKGKIGSSWRTCYLSFRCFWRTLRACQHFDTGNSTPIKQHPRRIPYAHRDDAERQRNEMLDKGIIRESTSPWSSPIISVKKKDGKCAFVLTIENWIP